MPQVFDCNFQQQNFSAKNTALLRAAYVLATRTLGIADGPFEQDRLALVEIIQQLANIEPFRKPEHMATLAVEWFRSRR